MIIKTIFKINGMHCTSCTLAIDYTLEETEGITESATHFAKAQTEIKYDPNVINEKQIMNIIQKLGYDSIPL